MIFASIYMRCRVAVREREITDLSSINLSSSYILIGSEIESKTTLDWGFRSSCYWYLEVRFFPLICFCSMLSVFSFELRLKPIVISFISRKISLQWSSLSVLTCVEKLMMLCRGLIWFHFWHSPGQNDSWARLIPLSMH